MQNHSEWLNEILTEGLYEEFCHEYSKEWISKNQFGIQLRKFCSQVVNIQKNRTTTDPFGEKHIVGVRFYRFPSLEECRTQFELKINSEIEWDVDKYLKL